MPIPLVHDADTLLPYVVRCIDHQGVRATARKLGWHPSKVSRARHRFRGLSVYDVIALVEALGGYTTFQPPHTDRLIKGRRGRPPGSFADLVR